MSSLGIYPEHLRSIIRQTLSLMDEADPGIFSQAAEEQVIGTAAQESHMGRYLKQIRGPAIGIYQIEPPTYLDLWRWLWAKRPKLAATVRDMASVRAVRGPKDPPDVMDMQGNLWLATAMCRVFYRRLPDALPPALQGQAELYKRRYNTYKGKATVEEYIANYRRFIG